MIDDIEIDIESNFSNGGQKTAIIIMALNFGKSAKFYLIYNFSIFSQKKKFKKTL